MCSIYSTQNVAKNRFYPLMIKTILLPEVFELRPVVSGCWPPNLPFHCQRHILLHILQPESETVGLDCNT